MTSVKVKFKPAVKATDEGSIFYQIIHDRKVAQLAVNYHLFACEWDSSRASVNIGNDSIRTDYLYSLRERIRLDLERLSKVIGRLESTGLGYTVADISAEYRRSSSACLLFNFMGAIIHRLKRNGKIRTAGAYVAMRNSFKRFLSETVTGLNANCPDGDIMIDSMTAATVEAYEAHLKSRGVVPNTTSFYMRILRAVYNRAVECGIVEQCYPFRHVYTGVDRTVKRALPLSDIRKIKGLDLSLYPSVDYARDMFMLSFYLRGMSFVDMAFLRKCDLKNGYVSYRRRKTGQFISIKWTSEMCSILKKYPSNVTEYLLPIIINPNSDERYAYLNRAYSVNYNLKKIANMIGVNIPLTFYCARHSWASAAHTKGIPISVISEGMGHDSESTTQIYLASLDSSVVDRANSLILRSLES